MLDLISRGADKDAKDEVSRRFIIATVINLTNKKGRIDAADDLGEP